jgi:diguanylate cyclase (GGDEF)-like protein
VVVNLLKPMDEVRAPYRQMARMLGFIVGATLLAAIAAGVVLGRSAARPIQSLAAGAQRVARGDYAHAIEASGGQELQELARAFNAMQTGIAEREEQLLHGARHDAATGLPNRRHAEEWLGHNLQSGADSPDVLVVLLVITNLQELSAGFGFEFADQLMRHLATALDRMKDEHHLVARLDTGRFAVLIRGAGAVEAHILAEELQRSAMAPLRVADLTLRPMVVAGCALAPLHGANAVEVLRCAEAAVESARAENQSVGWFAVANDAAQRRRLTIGADLPSALAGDQLRLHFQPKVGLGDRHATSVEALARWRHPELGEISPAEFVAVAEHTGASRLLSQWVLKVALRQLSAWYESGLKIDVAVNLSATDICDPQLLEYILGCLRDVRVPAGSLTLEITESAFMADAAGARRNMELLRVAGVRFSIDDFGTGYSSLSQLRQLAVDEVKIDRSFVSGMIDNVEDAAIIRSVIDLGHGLGLRVVAEGVETEEQWRALAQLGCDYAQGYLISRPLPAAELEPFLRQTAVDLASPLSQTATLQVLGLRRRS